MSVGVSGAAGLNRAMEKTASFGLEALVTSPERQPAARPSRSVLAVVASRSRCSSERRPSTISTPAPKIRSTSYAIWDARMSDETPRADSAAHISTPALLPTTADMAARRPSRAATRRIVAVPGPGVSVTTSATIRNSVADRTNRR